MSHTYPLSHSGLPIDYGCLAARDEHLVAYLISFAERITCPLMRAVT